MKILGLGECAILIDDHGYFMAASYNGISYVDRHNNWSQSILDLLLTWQVGCNRILVEAGCMKVLEVMHGCGEGGLPLAIGQLILRKVPCFVATSIMYPLVTISGKLIWFLLLLLVMWWMHKTLTRIRWYACIAAEMGILSKTMKHEFFY